MQIHNFSRNTVEWKVKDFLHPRPEDISWDLLDIVHMWSTPAKRWCRISYYKGHGLKYCPVAGYRERKLLWLPLDRSGWRINFDVFLKISSNTLFISIVSFLIRRWYDYELSAERSACQRLLECNFFRQIERVYKAPSQKSFTANRDSKLGHHKHEELARSTFLLKS